MILLGAAWLSICLVHKPEAISQKTIDRVAEIATSEERLDSLDRKVLFVIGITFALWISSNWTGWDATGIAAVSYTHLDVYKRQT